MKRRLSSCVVLTLVTLMPALASAAQVNISVGDNFFSPKTISVNPGDTVVWTNSGAMAHTVTADDGSFGSGTLQPGQTYSRTLSTAGTYSYYCQFHGGAHGAGMAGTVTVSVPASTQATSNATTSTSSQTSTQATYSQSVAALTAQVQILTQLLAKLQAQRASGSAVNSSSCAALPGTLGPGSSGAGVTALQQFLARDPSVYPEAKITGYYGALTTAAVQRFQAKNGIVSSGTPATTGYGKVGPKTLAAINARCGGTGAAGASDVAGGFIQVSPITGAAPLYVSVQATVNTTNSCGAALYTVDFGDGASAQQISVAAGTCQSEQQTYTHTYSSNGTYLVTLASGAHQSSATVVVQ